MEPTARASIRAIGTALPPFALDAAASEQALARLHGLEGTGRRRLRALIAGSRIARRYAVIGQEDGHFAAPFAAQFAGLPGTAAPGTAERMQAFAREAPPLAARAAEDCFRQPGAPDRSLVTHLLVTTCTGFLAPGLDVLLVRALGLPGDVGRTLVGFQGCQAGLSALRLADSICRAAPGAVALIVSVECCTLHFQAEPTDDNLLANCLFADGAAALLVAAPDVPVTAARFDIDATATFLDEDSLDQMTWTVGDTGFRLHLGGLIPRVLSGDVVASVARRFGLEDATTRARWSFAVHPGGAAILDALERRLEIPRLDASRRVLERCGNMSSPTIHFVLDELLRDGASAGPCLALAFGPGLTVEAAALSRRPAP